MQGESMRKIDTEAYNKRLHTEIMELDKMIKSINPENVNQIDASLIRTADNYIRLISDATWADNSNFNGIEMHKVKDLFRHLKKSRKVKAYRRIYLENDLNQNSYNDDGSPFTHIMHSIQVDDEFDGRQSLVIPRIIWYSGRTVAGVSYLFQLDEKPIIGEEIYSQIQNNIFVVRKSAAKIDIEWSGETAIYKELSDNPRICSAALAVFYMLWR
jgi:hypothetical protein